LAGLPLVVTVTPVLGGSHVLQPQVRGQEPKLAALHPLVTTNSHGPLLACIQCCSRSWNGELGI